MAKVQRKTTNTKRKVKKNVEHGQAHIQSSFNNTIVTLTDARGNALSCLPQAALDSAVQGNLLPMQLRWLQKLQRKQLFRTVLRRLKSLSKARVQEEKLQSVHSLHQVFR
jgi:hypothetical protein